MSSAGWQMKKCSYRLYQLMMKLVIKCVKYKEQIILSGKDSILKVPNILKEKNIDRILLVCSRTVRKKGLIDGFLEELEKANISYELFEEIQPNPTIKNAEEGYKHYLQASCQAIVAIGGGSPIDCAKIVGVRVSNPNISYEEMKHLTKIKKPIPFFIAVPTTAGTGTESTVGGVITNTQTRSKYAVLSPLLIPDCAVLDEALTIGLPKQMTAYTGMDALTHAIEAYIGTYGTSYTDSEALTGIKLIFENLEVTYLHGDDLKLRKKLLIASNHAANAFTRAYIGYVHNISHALSAIYDVGHGKTNAIILPYVLEAYGKHAEKKLAEIAVYTGLGKESEDRAELASKVIQKIRSMNEHMQIPTQIDELKEKDIDLIVKMAIKEGNPSFPVPKIMNEQEMKEIVYRLAK